MHKFLDTWFNITRLVDQTNRSWAAGYVLFIAAVTFLLVSEARWSPLKRRFKNTCFFETVVSCSDGILKPLFFLTKFSGYPFSLNILRSSSSSARSWSAEQMFLARWNSVLTNPRLYATGQKLEKWRYCPVQVGLWRIQQLNYDWFGPPGE